MNTKEISINGVYSLFGAIIRAAIEDYAEMHIHKDAAEAYINKYAGLKKLPQKVSVIKAKLRDYESAKTYLFKEDRLEKTLNKLSIFVGDKSNWPDIDAVRSHAEKEAVEAKKGGICQELNQRTIIRGRRIKL